MRASLATIASSQGRNGAPAAEARQRPPRLEERVLGRLLGVVWVGAEHAGGPEGDGLVGADERVERRGVASARPVEELVLPVGRPAHHRIIYAAARRVVPGTREPPVA